MKPADLARYNKSSMGRTETEIKLLKILQTLQDALAHLRGGKVVVSLDKYRIIMIRYTVCRELLREYRDEFLARTYRFK